MSFKLFLYHVCLGGGSGHLQCNVDKRLVNVGYLQATILSNVFVCVYVRVCV